MSCISLQTSHQNVFTPESLQLKQSKQGREGREAIWDEGFRAGSANLESHLRVILMSTKFLVLKHELFVETVCDTYQMYRM